MVRICCICESERAALKRPKTSEQLCKACFFTALEEEVHQTITQHHLFSPGERVAVAASGGKDSTVLAHMLTLLNERHGYGLDLFLLSIDEGITGYRDDSLETVKRNEAQYGIPLKILSYKDLYGWTMDEIVAAVGHRNNCTFCGVFRRQALDRGATLMKADKMATGHNADDMAETVLLNILRGDVPRLKRCHNIVTGEAGSLPRCKPFKYTYEKEIVMYAHFKKLDYFSTECIYSPFAARGAAREFVKDLELARPRAILDLIRSAEEFRFTDPAEGGAKEPVPGTCGRCGYISSQAVCKACLLLEGLNRGLPGLGIGRARRLGGSCNGKGREGGGVGAIRAEGSCSKVECRSGSGAGQEQDECSGGVVKEEVGSAESRVVRSCSKGCGSRGGCGGIGAKAEGSAEIDAG